MTINGKHSFIKYQAADIKYKWRYCPTELYFAAFLLDERSDQFFYFSTSNHSKP